MTQQPSSPAPRFLADQMLVRLARNLRFLGYDCETVERGKSDEALIKQARASGQLLITSARSLEPLAPDVVIVVPLEGYHSVVRFIIAKWPLNFHETMFTRCSLCNTPVQPLDPLNASQKVPEQVLQDQLPLTECPRCRLPYWEGGHVARLRTKLARLYGVP